MEDKLITLTLRYSALNRRFQQNFTRTLFGLTALSLIACQPPTVPLQGSAHSFASPLQNWRSQVFSTRALVQTHNGNLYIPNVPFVAQGEDNTCAQAVMTMLLQFWGHEIDYQTVVNEGNPFNLGTSYQAIHDYLRSKNLHVQGYRDGSLNALLSELHAARPVMVLLNFGALQYQHYVLITGYNARRNTLILHESRSGPYREIDVNQFLTMWNNEPLVHLPLFGGPDYYRLMFVVKSF